MFQKLGIRVGRKALLLGAILLVLAGTQVGCFPVDLPFPVFAFVIIDLGPHASFVNIPLIGSFIVTASEFGPTDPLTGDDPIRLSAGNDFGTFEGNLKRDGTYSATAMGTAAGFPGVEKKLNATIDRATGVIEGTLVIGSNGALPGGQSITYGLTSQLEIPPGTSMFAFMPAKMGFFSRVGENPPDQTLKVENAGTGGLAWFATVLTGQNFLSGSPLAGQAPSEVTVSVSSSTLTKGNHVGELEFTGFPEGGVLNSPLKVRVEFALDTPYLYDDGIVPGDDFNGPVVAGGIASGFGWNLARDVASANMLPLPRTLDDTTFFSGGGSVYLLRLPSPATSHISAPLFFVSPGQVNFQVPWEFAGQTEFTLTANLGADASFSRTIQLASFSPGIFTLNQQGTGQGAILIANTDTLAAPAGSVLGRTSRPASVGEFISIFCNGLGAVTDVPATGEAASASPLSTTNSPVTVNIGSIDVPADFAGLAPDFVGLNQVNVPIPAGVTPGDAVPVTLTIGGVTSNLATIAVQ